MAVLLAALATPLPAATAAPADLDASWDRDGIVVTPGPPGRAVAQLPDGRLVVGGGRRLLRYNPDGSLDTSFGAGGAARSDIDIRAIAVQPDGRIVVAGQWSQPSFPIPGAAVARHHADGSVDDGFGIRWQGFGWRGSAVNGLAVAPSGRILAGVATPTGGGPALTVANVAALAPPGDLDRRFGDDGVRTLIDDRNDGRGTYASALALQPDGKIVVAGGGDVAGNSWPRPERFFLARLHPDGDRDKSFGGDGYVVNRIGHSSAARAVAVQGDGKIVAAGWTWDGLSKDGLGEFSGRRFALVRLNRNGGTLDRGFDGDGIVTTDMGSGAMASGVALLPGGGVVAVGSERSVFPSRFALAAYQSDGALDPRFDGDGRLTTELGRISAAEDVLVQPDGRLVVVGSAQTDSGADATGVARYLGEATAIPPPPDPVPVPSPDPGTAPPAVPAQPATPRTPVLSSRLAVLAPSRLVLRGRRPKLSVRVEGTRGATASMVLKRSGRVVARRTLRLTGRITRARLRIPARARAGRHLLTVSVPGADGKPIRGTVAVRLVRPRR